MARILQHGEELTVAIWAAAIFGRARLGAGHADRVLFTKLGLFGTFDVDAVLPAVAES